MDNYLQAPILGALRLSIMTVTEGVDVLGRWQWVSGYLGLLQRREPILLEKDLCCARK